MRPILFSEIACAFILALSAAHARAQDKPGTTTHPTAAPSATPVPQKANERPASSSAAAPEEPFAHATVAEMQTRCVRLETEAGAIELEMLPESAPETVRHFLNLVASGALDTTTFSRVVPGFVVQGGNLSTRQTMSAEIAAYSRRTIMDEPNNVLHVRGVVSMARPDAPNGATTHFFILVGDAPYLNGKFAAFARVTKGMDVVDAINHAPVEDEKPVKPVRLTRATVFMCAPATTAPAGPPSQ